MTEEYAAKLPRKIGEFILSIPTEEEAVRGRRTYYFEYINPEGRVWSALYDDEVQDYTVHINLGLFEFVDISFISKSEEDFFAKLVLRLENSIQTTLVEPWHNFNFGYRQKEIHTWSYEEFLPERIGNFFRGISPDRGIRGINGSYIIAEYKKDKENTGLLLFYNVLREEFFCELRYKDYPEVTHLLDARSLTALERVLAENLETLLHSLDSR